MGRYHGSLVGANWHGTARLGGFGQISTNGSSTYVDCGTPIGFNNATQAVLGVWIYKGSAGETAGCGGAGGTANTGPRFSFIWFTDGNIYFSADTVGSTRFGYFTQGDSGWHRIVGVFDGTGGTDAERLRVYSDGAPQTLTLLGPFPSSLGVVGPITAGKDASDRFCGGSYDDLSLWVGRAFSDKDALADYELSRLGYPDVLNHDRFNIFSIAPNSYGSNVNVSKQGILSGAATHTVPVYHASGILSKSAVFSGSSTFVVPIYHSNTDIIKDLQFSSSATNVALGFDTTCFVSKAAQFSCSATVNNPVIHGVCALSKSSQFSATGSAAVPVYHANADINKGSSFSSGATFQAPIFAGSFSSSKSAQVSSAATVIVPVYHAGASLTKSPQISSAFSPQYHAACALTVAHIENSSANFSITAKVAVLAISKHPTTYGVGSLTIPPHAAIAVSKRVIFMGHAVNSNPNPDRPFYYVRRRHYIKKTFFS